MRGLTILFFLLIGNAVYERPLLAQINMTKRDSSLKTTLPFPIGVALKLNLLKNRSDYRNIIIKEFNSITAENAMKFNALHPGKDVYRWSDADYIVDFAVKNRMRVHGHTLIWPKVNPKWIENFQGDSTAWENLLKTHIQTVVTHFKGKVTSWDVVNEAFGDNGKLKNTIWLRKLGPNYINRCFIYAHEADPAALLFYNDYGQEFGGNKMRAILVWIAKAQKNKVPIDGLGFQMHTVLRVSTQRIRDNVNEAVKTGLLLHFSELDIAVRYNQPKGFIMSTKLSEEQAQKYKEIFQIYASIPPKQQFGITMWGVGDRDSYLNAKSRIYDYPLLFDHQYLKKPAYKAILESVK